ncbi:hypothetical protein QBC40DRAFT_72724 [Triangularia verruculosa]|uniref:2EXR domain-containing protein n=1 Tax=Triangularia verruculosa TaxID=2587418 RepID=A0AAN6XIF9_9PEZI|nr:hypothetical protein QBC40DRAFT_72724 [Triangularia verruculosa]
MMHYDQNYHRRGFAQTPTEFRNFQRLPAEIRNMIWEYSLPESRVYEVMDAPSSKQKTPAQKGLMFANVHPEPPPALSAVCQESRYFVLHHYKPLTLGPTTKYVDLSRDILLLEPYLLVKRLHRTLHFMSQIPLVRDNINRLALGTSYGIYPGIFHPVLSWKVSKTNMHKLMTSLSKFPKLQMLVFVVHQEFQFEFDFRYTGGMAHSQFQGSATAMGGYPSPAPSHPLSGTGTPMSALSPSSSRLPTPSSSNASSPLPPQSLPLPPMPPMSASSGLYPASSESQYRPQQIHQAYRFKFDIEANINHQPRRPHHNELSYYPLPIDEEKDDWDLGEIGEEGEWCDPRPTNDDWRRFRKRFMWAMDKSTAPLEEEKQEKSGMKRGAEDDLRGLAKKLKLKGASLLWRYTSQRNGVYSGLHSSLQGRAYT